MKKHLVKLKNYERYADVIDSNNFRYSRKVSGLRINYEHVSCGNPYRKDTSTLVPDNVTCSLCRKKIESNPEVKHAGNMDFENLDLFGPAIRGTDHWEEAAEWLSSRDESGNSVVIVSEEEGLTRRDVVRHESPFDGISID
jgi:hypothetical protein